MLTNQLLVGGTMFVIGTSACRRTIVNNRSTTTSELIGNQLANLPKLVVVRQQQC